MMVAINGFVWRSPVLSNQLFHHASVGRNSRTCTRSASGRTHQITSQLPIRRHRSLWTICFFVNGNSRKAPGEIFANIEDDILVSGCAGGMYHASWEVNY